MEDWDLQAVVKGYNNVEAFVNKPACFAPLNIQFENLDFATFYDTPESTTILDEFGDSHKFFPHNILSSFVPEEKDQHAGNFQEQQQRSIAVNGSPVASSTVAASPTSRPKRRKSHENRVVEELTIERLKLDIWAWRKYGQKPIKGSPYLRSYYRCSSSKGCPARRQVQQSATNPHMFTVTYSAEHNHAKPTKRSSLAGTTRKKSNCNIHEEDEQVITNELNDMATRTVDGEVSNDGECCESSSNNTSIPDVIFSENFFPTLEEMAGIPSEWIFEFDS